MKQTDSEVVIFGVGRSGTTALFKYMTEAFSLLEAKPEIRYEPFLWNINEAKPLQESFNSTAGHSMPGLYAHTRSPMFTQATDLPSLDTFVSDLDIQGTPSLVKFIRACGRVEYFLNAWPNAKFIYIFRNPCSVINSVLPMFDFFGSEFHQSDKTRFAQEAGIDATEFEQASYPQQQLMYWRAMNDAALLSCQKFPDRILPISQEALMVNPEQTLRTISNFCFGEDAVTEDFMAGLAGDETPRPLSYNFYNMASPDRDAFAVQTDWYIDTLLPACRAGVEVDRDVFRKALSNGWPEDADEVKDFNDPDRASGPLVNRNMLVARTTKLSDAQEKFKTTFNELNALRGKHSAVTKDLSETKSQLSATTDRLAAVSKDLDDVTSEKNVLETQVSTSMSQLSATTDRLAAVSQNLDDVSGKKKVLETRVSTSLELATYLEEYLTNTLNEYHALQDELAIRTTDPNVRLAFRSSAPRRVGLAVNILLGKPVKKDRAVLLVPLTNDDLSQVPDQLKWKSSNPIKRVAFYLKCVFGGVISLEKFFDSGPVKIEGTIMMKRNGPFLRRVFSSLKHIVKSKVSTRKFSLSYIKLA